MYNTKTINYLEQELYELIAKDESIFDFLQNTSMDGLSFWDLNHQENHWVNSKFWETLGFNPAEIPDNWSLRSRVIDQYEFDEANKNFLFQSEIPNLYDQIIKYRHKKGNIIWMRSRAMIIRNESDEPIRMLGTHIDISEQKHKEEILDRCNQSAIIGHWNYDVVTAKVYWSKITKQIHEVPDDYQPNLTTGINFYKEGESRDTITRVVNLSINDGVPYDVELQIITANGKEKWVRAIGKTEFYKGNCIKMYGTFQDIHKEKMHEQLILTEKEKLQSFFDLTLDFKSILTFDGEFETVNHTYYDELGHTEEELLGKPLITIIHPDDINETKQEIFKLSQGIKTLDFENRCVKKNGKYIWLNWRAFPDIKTGKIYATARNVTTRKKRQQELKSVLELTQKQNDHLRNFAHIVSHNLRSHSQNIGALIAMSLAQPNDPKQKELMEMIKSSSDSLSQTINDLSEVANMNADKKHELKKINLHTSVQNILKSTNALFEESEMNITLDMPYSTTIWGNQVYVDSILLNLITNAIKYRSPERESYLRIFTTKENKFLVLHIADNGLGIDLDIHGHKVFGMYKTFHDEQRSDSKGLGLFITKNQIEAIGGTIEVQSQIGSGSTFKVYFKHEESEYDLYN